MEMKITLLSNRKKAIKHEGKRQKINYNKVQRRRSYRELKKIKI